MSGSDARSYNNGRKRQAKASVLSEDQKKKRRENIRSEFDKIVSLTPTLTESENRSELNILTKSADYIDYLKAENDKLVELFSEKGMEAPRDLVYTGPDQDVVLDDDSDEDDDN